jgi:hypothetical protein
LAQPRLASPLLFSLPRGPPRLGPAGAGPTWRGLPRAPSPARLARPTRLPLAFPARGVRGRLQQPPPPWWDPPVIAPVVPCSSPSPPRRTSLSPPQVALAARSSPCPGVVCPRRLVLRGEPRHHPPLPRRPLLLPRHLLATSVARHVRPRPGPGPLPVRQPAPARAASPLPPAQRARPPLARLRRARRTATRGGPRCGLCPAQPHCACGAARTLPPRPARGRGIARPMRSPTRGVLPARCLAWGAAHGGLAQAQLAAARHPVVVRRLPGAAPSCARCLGAVRRVPVRHVALRHACDEPVYPPAYSVYPPPPPPSILCALSVSFILCS